MQQHTMVPPQLAATLKLPTMLDQLGRDFGETSKLAVVVADLNGVGELLAGVAAQHLDEAGSVLSALTSAWCKALIAAVCAQVHEAGPKRRVLRDRNVSGLDIELAAAPGGGWFVPVRPWVSAGDDVVMVCESRAAWWLAATMVRWLDEPPTDPTDARARAQALFGRCPTVSVGISVMPVGVALSRVHAVASALCDNAKAAARHTSALYGESGTHHGLDWHRGVIAPEAVVPARTDERVVCRRPFVWAQDPGGDDPDSFATFTREWLGSGDRSLRGPVWSTLRSTVRGQLFDAATQRSFRHDVAPSDALDEAIGQLNSRRRQLRRAPVELPGWPHVDAGSFCDALDMRDEFLDLDDPGVSVT